MVATTDTRGLRGLLPLVMVSVVVVLIAFGQSRGLWVTNVHNALLALTFTVVGAYVLFQRPGHREGLLFMAAGLTEAIMFFGRQIGHSPTSGSSPWWGWLGVWPLVISLALCTFAVICFPDGRLPSPGWRWVAAAIVIITTGCAVLSAIWPVEYVSAGLITPHPFNADSPETVVTVWSFIAHPAYIGFQILWLVALAVRWRSSNGHVRRQLAWVVAAASVSVTALIVGLLSAATPVPGLITATLLPVAAGWAIVHGEHVRAYSALTWLSRGGQESADLPAAVAEALTATGAVLWMGPVNQLHAVGVWPETGDVIPATDLESLQSTPGCQVRAVMSNGTVVGALSIGRPVTNPLSLAEQRLFNDLAAQATLVTKHLTLAEVITGQQQAGHLDGLTPRERDVLELMALGMSNAAISRELHLSIKTVEPVVSTIFAKLDLHADAQSNRRVLAVLAFVRA